MGLFNIGRNTDYDDINDTSTDEDKLDVVFKILRKSSTPIWLNYDSLKIPYQNRKLFDVKLKATGLVAFRQDTSAYNPDFRLNDLAYLILEEHGSYKNYLDKLRTDKKSKKIWKKK